MMYQNRVSIIGFVGYEAQLKSTKNGAPVAASYFHKHHSPFFKRLAGC
jgi:hypothetical protein